MTSFQASSQAPFLLDQVRPDYATPPAAPRQGVRSDGLHVGQPVASPGVGPPSLTTQGSETGSRTARSPMSDAPLSEALAALSRFLVVENTVEEPLQRVS